MIYGENTMNKVVDTVVVGGGQAGLATSYLLKQSGIDHLVFDRGRVADTWRKKRWDSFCLVTQNWQCQLPGFPYKGDDPDGFMTREEVIGYLQSYAEFVNPPLKSDVTVGTVRYDESQCLYIVDTSIGSYRAVNVIIAAGTYHNSRIPKVSANLSPEITQLHSSDYKNPESLPKGGVLVVGSGQSGCQIAEDLLQAGRNVHLSVSGAPRIPRSYRGKDILQWANEMGLYDMPVNEHPEGKSIRFKTHPHVTGRDGGHTINLRQLALEGATLYGRLADTQGTRIFFKNDLIESIENADSSEEKFTRTIEEFIQKNGIDAPEDTAPIPKWEPGNVSVEIDLAEEDISSIIWATGYGYDFSWIDAPVFDERGYPIYERGVTDMPGLYFVGLHWMYRWGSGLFYGVRRDAEYIVDHIKSGTENTSHENAINF